ncbi:MAG: CHAT domain-containing protein [Gammaproteobacteria bacterium]|nr:CHAT domain-containing protein [Gammaproteobacteria bacterium]
MKIKLIKLTISIIFSLLSFPVFSAAISDPVVGEIDNLLDLAKKASLKQENLIALDHLRHAISLARENTFADRELTALIDTTTIHQRMGQQAQAERNLLRISEIVAFQDGPVMARGHRFLATYFLQHGDLEKSRESLHVAVDSYRVLGDELRLTESLLDLGFGDVEMSEYELAEKAFEEAFELAKQSKYKLLATIAALNLAKARQHRNPRLNVDELLVYVENNIRSSTYSSKLLELSISLAGFFREQSHRSGIAIRDSYDYRKRAYAVYRNALRLAKQYGKVRDESYAYGGIGRLYSDEGRYQEAALYFSEASMLAHESSSPDSYFRWDIELALAKGKNKNSDALSYFRLAMRIVDKEINTILGLEPEAYQNLLRDFYEQYLEAIARQDRGGGDETLARESYHVVSTLKLSEVLSQHSLRPIATVSSNEHKLGSVDYLSVVTRDKLYIVVNDHKRFHLKVVDVGRNELHRQVIALRKAIDQERDVSDLAESLYKYLIFPIASIIPSANKLRFSHDGLLRAIPMAVLQNGKEYLIESYAIEYFVADELQDFQWEREDELLHGRSEQWSNLRFTYSQNLIGIGSRLLIDRSNPQGDAETPGLFGFEGDLVQEIRKNDIKSLVVSNSQWSSDEVSLLLIPKRIGVKRFVSTLWYGERLSSVINDNVNLRSGQLPVDEQIQQIQVSLLKMKLAPKFWSSPMVVSL